MTTSEPTLFHVGRERLITELALFHVGRNHCFTEPALFHAGCTAYWSQPFFMLDVKTHTSSSELAFFHAGR